MALENLFKLKENKTNVRTEILAGITTFFASMFAILTIPGMVAGQNVPLTEAVFFAATISSVIATLFMAFIANLPFVQTPGMGLGAFFAFSVMPVMGTLSGLGDDIVAQYQMSLPLVLIAGLLFILATFGGIREKIINGMPKNVKAALGTGIGMFITFLGLRQAGIVVSHGGNFVQLINFSNWAGNSRTITGAILSLVGFFVMVTLYTKKVKTAFLIGILLVTVLAYITGHSTIPEDFSFSLVSQAGNFMQFSFFKMDFSTVFVNGGFNVVIGPLISIILAFTLVNTLDSLGTIFGISKSAGMVNEKGEVVGLKKGLLCDALGTASGALLGSTTTTTVVASATGISSGGRTGLTALTTAILYIGLLVLAPFVRLIPQISTAPALMMIGALMITHINEVDFTDLTEAVPAFLTIVVMPLTFSIANGIAFGLISYVFIKLLTGRRKDITAVSVIFASLFIIQYIL